MLRGLWSDRRDKKAVLCSFSHNEAGTRGVLRTSTVLVLGSQGLFDVKFVGWANIGCGNWRAVVVGFRATCGK
jgi:hypothetical protein